MRALLIAAAAAALVGCAGNIKLIEDGKVHYGTYSQASRSIEVSIDGVKYIGNYTQNTTVGFGQSFGTAFSGNRSASGTSIGTMVASNGAGQAILTGENGKAIQCMFQAQMGQGNGVCEGLDGRRFLLVIGGDDPRNPNNQQYQQTKPGVCSGAWVAGRCT